MVFMLEEIVGNVTGAVHHNITQIGVLFLKGGFGPGSYYYPIMIQFIFYFPVLFGIIKKYNFSGLILCAFINLFYEILKYSYGMNEECYRLLLFRYTLLIAYGCYLAMGNFNRHNILSVICMCIGITYIIICKYMRIVPLITNFWTGTSLWACLFIIPISAPIILNKASNRFVETLGRASYDIFLIQMVYYNGAGFIYSLVDKRWMQLLINIVICVSMGLIFYCIETPITKTINDKAYGITMANSIDKYCQKRYTGVVFGMDSLKMGAHNKQWGKCKSVFYVYLGLEKAIPPNIIGEAYDNPEGIIHWIL